MKNTRQGNGKQNLIPRVKSNSNVGFSVCAGSQTDLAGARGVFYFKEGAMLQRLVQEMSDADKRIVLVFWVFVIGFTAAIFLAILCVSRAHAWEVTNQDALATAIYHAEGGASTRHPYGILAKYKTTTPRQACINTIRHALRDWDGRGDFIAFLGSRYAPVGAKNDPSNLNSNWVRNVRVLYAKMTKRGN